MRIAAVVSYDGTLYGGWQIQKNSDTVQQQIEDALQRLLGSKTKITGSGRTDAGVHAERQVFHFDSDKTSIPPEKYAVCLNNLLPKDIRIITSGQVDKSFHARYSVLKKTYCYNMYISKTVLPLKDRYSLNVETADTEKMREAASLICGTHDFSAFSSSGSSVKDTVRTIYFADIEKSGDDIKITLCGNGFLYNMVRIISGALLSIGQGKANKDIFMLAFEEKKRSLLGKTLPARGLVLKNTEYASIYKIY